MATLLTDPVYQDWLDRAESPILRAVISERSPLGLGSASPRRRALLEGIGLPLVLVPVDVDERCRGDETPEAYLARVVEDKLEAALADDRARGASVVLVADTIVLLGGQILGKPAGSAEARSMLTQLAGRTHEVRTRFALGVSGRGAVHAETVATAVEFRALDTDEIDRYVATGEGTDKAGAYAIQGIGSFAVRRIEGSYANVVGLPVCEVIVALRHTGHLATFP
jgi:septum formation protein